METRIATGQESFDTFYPRVRAFLEKDVSEFAVDGRKVRGYRSPDTPLIWLRDHTHQMKGFRYFEKDMKSAVTDFIANQMPDGSFHDAIRETGQRFRVECEADVEYLLVEAVYTVWQATGDDEWAWKAIGPATRGLHYSMSHIHRWSRKHGLVKRPFTIDTWDFVYNPDGVNSGGGIDANTDWCILHGDNTGMFQACMLLARLYDHFGNPMGYADYWRDRARRIRSRLMEICWNGTFFTHQVHITPVEVAGVDEGRQLSLSNAYALNRGVLTSDQAASVISEYQRRREETRGQYFAEWFSIHPAFPPGSFDSRLIKRTTWTKNPGEYVNGGVLPLVGGELARGAFENGFEEYGLDILQRYYAMISEKGETYLWYHPDGSPGRSGETTLPTDGWGSSAMLAAFLEGLVGVRDESSLMKRIRLSPRWAAAGVRRAQATVGYEVSGAGVSYDYRQENGRITLSYEGTGCSEADFHVLLPAGTRAARAENDGNPVPFENISVRRSPYCDVRLRELAGKTRHLLAIDLKGSGT